MAKNCGNLIGNEIAIFTCEIAGIEKKITIDMGTNPMGNMGMDPTMMNQVMGMNPMKSVTISDTEGWNLIFEDKKGNKKITVTISPDKTVQEAINTYKIKAGLDANENAKFIFNGKQCYHFLLFRINDMFIDLYILFLFQILHYFFLLN